MGADGERIGDVALNTGVVGFQETLTDPSNAGKILAFTYPLIGNYGFASKFGESDGCWAAATVFREMSRIRSNWQAEGSFDGFLKSAGTVALSEVDTRTLAVHIRDRGEMRGIVSTKMADAGALLSKLKSSLHVPPEPILRRVSTREAREIEGEGRGPKVAILDLGILRSFMAQLRRLCSRIVLFPFDATAEAVLAAKPAAVLVSNGPEDDPAIMDAVRTVGGLLGRVPLGGIAAGFEVIGMAAGGKRYRLKVGHRGANYPVLPPSSPKGEITVQNHSYGIEPDSIEGVEGITVTLRNANDGSAEEMESAKLRMVAAQYYPKSPGCGEIHPFFSRFLAMAG